jgi:hypothetical protein
MPVRQVVRLCTDTIQQIPDSHKDKSGARGAGASGQRRLEAIVDPPEGRTEPGQNAVTNVQDLVTSTPTVSPYSNGL